jgi:hypothetical protein
MREKIHIPSVRYVIRPFSSLTFASITAVALSVLPSPPASAAEPPPSQAAQSIAEKFAGAASADEAQKRLIADEEAARKKAIAAKKRAQASRAAAKQREQDDHAAVRKADEAEMLLRAKTEAAARDVEQKRADEELARAVDAVTAAQQAATERARAELAAQEQAQEAEAIRRVAENRKREQEALAAAEPPKPATAEHASNAAPETPAHDDARRALVALREAETLQLATRLKEARRAKAAELERAELEQKESEARQASERKTAVQIAERENEAKLSAAASQIQPQPTPTTAPLSQAVAAPSLLLTSSTARATVLLILKPGTYGIRRFNQAQADPVLCAGDVCYISQGADAPAKVMPRQVALGAGNTLGTRAGACRLQLACIYRDVDFSTGLTPLQPVDLHVLRHDRREITTAAADQSCNLVSGSLVCNGPIDAKTYRAWIVPEATAQTVGGPALTAALQANLTTRSAAAN